MKKTAIFLMIFTSLICIVFGGLYKIDAIRMSKNLPVLYSTWGRDYTSAKKLEEASGTVYIDILEKHVNSRGLTFDIFNKSQSDILITEYFTLERKVDDEWKPIDYVDSNYPDWDNSEYLIYFGEGREIVLYWADIYGELPSGEYRLVKPYYDLYNLNEEKYLYCTFEI